MEASKRGDLATVLGLMTDDVVFMVPGRPPFGNEAFAASSQAMQDGVQIEGTSDIKTKTDDRRWYSHLEALTRPEMSEGMIPLYRFVAAGCLALTLAACATGLEPVRDWRAPMEKASYSILPPTGDNWYYLDSKEATGESTLTFARRFDSPTHHLVAMVAEIHDTAVYGSPEDFLAFVKKSQQFSTDPQRFTFQKNDMWLDDKFGAYTVQFYTKAEDRRAENTDGQVLHIETLGYAFVHPHRKEVTMFVTYSERGVQGELDRQLKASARRFVDGLKLKPADR